jgi:hypothetical protein
MTDEPLRRLSDAERSAAWDAFFAAFAFRPGSGAFPQIAEPVPSATWTLRNPFDTSTPGRRRVTDLVQRALTACSPPGAALLALNWQHTCYQLRPDLPPSDMFLSAVAERRSRPGWPFSPVADGDYALYLADEPAGNPAFGTFGNPAERSLCVFGARLLDAVAHDLDELLPRIRNQGGTIDG